MVTKYNQLSGFLNVQKAWAINCPSENRPKHRIILAHGKKIQKTGSIHNLPHVATKGYLNQLVMQKGSDFRSLLSLPPEALTTMIVSDEAWFYLTLSINKQKDRTWSKEKSRNKNY